MSPCGLPPAKAAALLAALVATFHDDRFGGSISAAMAARLGSSSEPSAASSTAATAPSAVDAAASDASSVSLASEVAMGCDGDTAVPGASACANWCFVRIGVS